MSNHIVTWKQFLALVMTSPSRKCGWLGENQTLWTIGPDRDSASQSNERVEGIEVQAWVDGYM